MVETSAGGFQGEAQRTCLSCSERTLLIGETPPTTTTTAFRLVCLQLSLSPSPSQSPKRGREKKKHLHPLSFTAPPPSAFAIYYLLCPARAPCPHRPAGLLLKPRPLHVNVIFWLARTSSLVRCNLPLRVPRRVYALSTVNTTTITAAFPPQLRWRRRHQPLPSALRPPSPPALILSRRWVLRYCSSNPARTLSTTSTASPHCSVAALEGYIRPPWHRPPTMSSMATPFLIAPLPPILSIVWMPLLALLPALPFVPYPPRVRPPPA